MGVLNKDGALTDEYKRHYFEDEALPADPCDKAIARARAEGRLEGMKALWARICAASTVTMAERMAWNLIADTGRELADE